MGSSFFSTDTPCKMNIAMVLYRLSLDRKGQETVKKLKKSVCIEEWGKDLLADVAGATLFSAGVYSFAVNADFAPGGITGLAILAHHFLPSLPIL